MDIIRLLAVIGLSCGISLMVCFGLYVRMINRALRNKDREIATLKMQLKKAQKKERIEVITVDGRNPQFGNF